MRCGEFLGGDFINTPLFSKGAGFYQTALEMVILGIAFIEIPRGNPRLQTREESRLFLF
jgi:hypothetical protein